MMRPNQCLSGSSEVGGDIVCEGAGLHGLGGPCILDAMKPRNVNGENQICRRAVIFNAQSFDQPFVEKSHIDLLRKATLTVTSVWL